MAKRKKASLSELRGTNISGLSMSELRSAYTTYRDVIEKRVKRLAEGSASQKAYAEPFLKGGSKQLLTLQQIDKFRRVGWTEEQLKREMEMRVKELQILEQKERLSIRGWEKIEQRTIQSLHSAGFENINKSNIAQFGSFMERMRNAFGNKIFPSDEVAELFNDTMDEAQDLSNSELFDMLADYVGDIYGVDLFS